MSKYTAGTWYFRPTLHDQDAPEAYAVLAEKGLNDDVPIALCWGPDAEANARLISTKPLLLDALRHLLREVVGDVQALSCVDLRHIRAAQDAIAKATGEKRE